MNDLREPRSNMEDFNMNLIRSLERIENKLDKESGSSKSRSHRTLEKNGRSRNGSRHHQHSQIIPIGENTVAQVHPLSENIGGMGWMS
jgi:hypothetical protein